MEARGKAMGMKSFVGTFFARERANEKSGRPERSYRSVAGSRAWASCEGSPSLSRDSAVNQCRVRLQIRQMESITGTSTSTPTTVTKAAPDSAPNNAIAVATANSKKLLAPINAPHGGILRSTHEPIRVIER